MVYNGAIKVGASCPFWGTIQDLLLSCSLSSSSSDVFGLGGFEVPILTTSGFGLDWFLSWGLGCQGSFFFFSGRGVCWILSQAGPANGLAHPGGQLQEHAELICVVAGILGFGSHVS